MSELSYNMIFLFVNMCVVMIIKYGVDIMKTEKKTKSNRDIIKSVQKTIELLAYMNEDNKSVGVRETSRILDVSKSTLQRILNTLLDENVIKFDESTQTYSLDYGAMSLASALMETNHHLKLIAENPMRHLRDLTGETVSLHQKVDNQQIVVYQIKSENELKWSMPTGQSYEIEKGASGKLLLAYLNDSERTHIMNELKKKLNESEITKLEKDIKNIKEKGYSISKAELSGGTMGIAVPIINKRTNDVDTVLSIYGPIHRIELKQIDKVVELLQDVSKTISNLLV